MRVLVAGQGKSGTTALFFALKRSLPPDYVCLFEPTSYRAAGEDRVLAKIIVGDPTAVRFADFEAFDKKILVVRDPRDTLISRLLYLTYDLSFWADDAKVASFVRMLEEKRRSPSSVSVVELFEWLSNLSGKDLLGRVKDLHRFSRDFDRLYPGYFVTRYEEFVTGNVKRLEGYLGFPLTHDGEIDPEYSRVVRRKTPGDWRNWFTAGDADYFRPIFDEHLRKYGYDMDWEPGSNQEILREYSTDYVMRLVEEKRALASAHRAVG